jgi:fructose transport system ATP-binding protein
LTNARAGIETVYQTLAVSPALDIASNMFLGREERMAGLLGLVFRKLDKRGMRNHAKEQMSKLGITTLQDMGQTVETLSGGQRQAVAVARAAAFGSKVIILDEPTAALGVRESNQVLDMIRELRRQGLPVILISHNMPHVFDVADRVHIQRLGRCAGVVSPATTTPEEAVAIMTGAKQLATPAHDHDRRRSADGRRDRRFGIGHGVSRRSAIQRRPHDRPNGRSLPVCRPVLRR